MSVSFFIGADLTHNNLSPKMKPSIAALVGSLDRTLLKYAPAVGVQPLLEPSDEDSRPRSQEVICSPSNNHRLLVTDFFFYNALVVNRSPSSFSAVC